MPTRYGHLGPPTSGRVQRHIGSAWCGPSRQRSLLLSALLAENLIEWRRAAAAARSSVVRCERNPERVEGANRKDNHRFKHDRPVVETAAGVASGILTGETGEADPAAFVGLHQRELRRAVHAPDCTIRPTGANTQSG
jgi:hypothetical protein